MMFLCKECGKDNKDKSKFCSSCGSLLVKISCPPGTLPPGKILENRYKIIKLIKSGGMGSVYKALNQNLDCICAVKELIPFKATEEEREKVTEWFIREAKLLARLNHINLPKVFDYFIENEKYYLIMTFIKGEDLITILEREGNPGLPEKKVIEWSLQILKVLDYLHNQKPVVIYRDLKPDNIMHTYDGQIILIDFGLARTINPAQDLRKTCRGTLGYSPLEQYEGNGEPRSDLYALGATMHHLLTGIEPLPFKFEPVKKTIANISPFLENIIAKSLEKKADKRFSSAKAMIKALEMGKKSQKTKDPQEKVKEYKIMAPPPEKLWDFKTNNIITSTPCFSEKFIYFGSDDSKLYCLNYLSGEKIWEFSTGDRVKTNPCVKNGFIYFGSNDHNVYCLKIEDGKKIWEFMTGYRVQSSPCLSFDKIYFGSHDNKLYCLNNKTGEKLWDFTTKGWIDSTPAISENMIYFGSRDNIFYCLDEITGKLIWSFETGHRIYSSPSISGSFIYFGSDDNHLYCLNKKNGAFIWKFETDMWLRSKPYIFDNMIYFGSDRFYCLNKNSGKFKWSFDSDHRIYGSPLINNRFIYFGCDQSLYCLDRKTGKLLWKYKTDSRVVSMPSIKENYIYFGGHSGKIYCLNLETNIFIKDNISKKMARDIRDNIGKYLFKKPEIYWHK